MDTDTPRRLCWFRAAIWPCRLSLCGMHSMSARVCHHRNGMGECLLLIQSGTKRVVALAMSTAVGNCGALISSNVFFSHEAPYYDTGFKVGLGMNGTAAISLTLLHIGLKVCNRRWERESEARIERSEAPETGMMTPWTRYQT